jgi:hypothetical protein
MRIQFDEDGVLSGKNEADNPMLNQFTATGELEAWPNIDEPPEEVGFGIYGRGPGFPRMTKQAEMDFEDPYFEQRDPLIEANSPPSASQAAPIAPFRFPPVLELVDSGFRGFAEGWYAFNHAWGIKGGLITNCSPITAGFLNQNQGAEVPMPDELPEGSTFVAVGMAGPFSTEAAALAANFTWEQRREDTNPRIPPTITLKGPLKTDKKLQFNKNETFVGERSGGKRKPRGKKRKRPGRRQKKREGEV